MLTQVCCTYIHTYRHTFMHTYVHRYIHPQACSRPFIHTYTYNHMHSRRVSQSRLTASYSLSMYWSSLPARLTDRKASTHACTRGYIHTYIVTAANYPIHRITPPWCATIRPVAAYHLSFTRPMSSKFRQWWSEKSSGFGDQIWSHWSSGTGFAQTANLLKTCHADFVCLQR